MLGARLRAAGLVCRLGGDEFALILTDVDEADARRVATRLLEVIRGPIAAAGTILRIEAIIGVAIATAGTQPLETVVRDADCAICQGKETGRGCYIIA